MFHNTKKLISEKVLQQYFFEKFMLANSNERKKLLPEKYQEYSSTSKIKGLNPEVVLGLTSNNKKHLTDFVLYPMPNSNLEKLNIEIKWTEEDFEKEYNRFEFYDGTKGNGFVVAIKHKKNHREFIFDKDNNVKTTIPVVYLDYNEFKKWFSKSAQDIISQTLYNKLNIPFSRLTGQKYWVITISDSAENHYINHGKVNHIWAFSDRNRPENIMKIFDNDYVIFVKLKKCMPGRMIYPYSKSNRKIETSRDSFVYSYDISWSIKYIEIFKVTKGYHINFTSKPPYEGFDENWMQENDQKPENKQYTQFIRLNINDNDPFTFLWNKHPNFEIDRSLFSRENEALSEFVKSVRESFNSNGDAREISNCSFESLLQLLSGI